MAADGFVTHLKGAEIATDDAATSRTTCQELDRIASDFHALMVAHCPLCNGMGPQCIVESMEEALAATPEGETEAEPRPLRQ